MSVYAHLYADSWDAWERDLGVDTTYTLGASTTTKSFVVPVNLENLAHNTWDFQVDLYNANTNQKVTTLGMGDDPQLNDVKIELSSQDYLNDLGNGVYWGARDFFDPAFDPNHHFFVVAFADDEPDEWEHVETLANGQRALVVGGFDSDGFWNLSGDLIIEYAKQNDMLALNDWIAGNEMDEPWEPELKQVPLPLGQSFLGFASLVYDLADIYTDPVDYSLVDRNCATLVNTIMAKAGVLEGTRESISDFNGTDWGEDDILPFGHFDYMSGLTVSTPSLIIGGSFTATATTKAIGALDRVELYRDLNGNGKIDVGTDQFLGEDENPGNSWNWSISTSGWSSGLHTLLATAWDRLGDYASEIVSRVINVVSTPEISISTFDSIASEPSNNGTFRITRTGGTASALTVNFNDPIGSAIRGTDYDLKKGSTILTGNSVTIDAEQSYVDVTVVVHNDDIDKDVESITLALASGSGYTLGGTISGTVTISDDDTAGVTVSPTSGLVTTEAGSTDSFTVHLNSQPTSNVTIDLSSNDTTEGTVSPTGLTFTPGNWNQAQTVTVAGQQDAQVDGSVAYTIVTAPTSSSDPKYSGLAVPDVLVTNLDDDVFSPAEIVLRQYNNEIYCGGSLTCGSAVLGGNGRELIFTIENTGDEDLTVGNIALLNNDGFTVIRQPDSVVSGHDSTTFRIQMLADTPGVKSTDVQFSNNDSDENPFTFQITGTVSDLPNTGPVISGISDQVIDEDGTTGAITFTVSDHETPAGLLVVTKESSNPALVPLNGIALGGGSGNRSVTVTPLEGQYGSAVITLTVSDGELTDSESFTLTVNSVNDPPAVNTSDGTTVYPANSPGIAIDDDVAVDDVDSIMLTGANVRIEGGFQADQDVLEFADQNGITGSYDSISGVLTLSGMASVSDYQAALRTIQYRNTDNNPVITSRNVGFTVNDGTDDSNTAYKMIDIALIQQPVIDVETDGRDHINAFDFGTVEIGETSTQIFTVRNEGNDSLVVQRADGFSGRLFNIEPANRSDIGDDWVIQPGETMDFNVTFEPTHEGLVNDTLELVNNDPDNGRYAIAFSGMGTGPEIDVEYNNRDDFRSYNFRNVRIGDSRTRPFTIRNEGDAVLTIERAVGLRSPFSVSPANGVDSNDDWTIQPGETMEFNVTFEPDRVGNVTDHLKLVSNDTDEHVYSIKFRGKGIASPDIHVTPGRYDFKNVKVGAKKTKVITIRNKGDAVLEVTRATGLHSPFIVSPKNTSRSNDDWTIRPGKKLQLKVTFKPASAGDFQDTLIVKCNDPDEPSCQVRLSGTGIASNNGKPRVTVSGTRLNLKEGDNKSYQIKVTRSGSTNKDLVVYARAYGKADFHDLIEPDIQGGNIELINENTGRLKITIFAGHRSVVVTGQAFDDAIRENTERINFRLQNNSKYKLNGNTDKRKISLRIRDND